LLEKGCNALAPICLFEDSDDEDYENANGVDVVGGVEAVISHILTREFLVPTAHAPAFRKVEISTKPISGKVAAEYITSTFLPCVILGLYNAPALIPIAQKNEKDIIVQDLKGLYMPYNSLGSTPVFKSSELNIPIFAVKSNKTILNVTKEVLGLDSIIEVENYF